MPPYQPPQQPTPQQPQNPYHFIMNPEQPRRSSSLGKPTGILFIVGAIAVVLVLIVVISSITRGGGSSKQPFVTVAQEQQEIARVAGLDVQQLQQANVKNFATTTQLSMTTDSTNFTTYMGKHGVKISQKQLAAGANRATDAQLTSAISRNTLDTTLRTILQDELKQYQTNLGKAYRNSTSPSTRAVLKHLNDNAQLLLTQSAQ